MANKFRTNDVRFRDTRGAGSITVRGINLTPEDGWIEGPSDLAKDIEPHGFLMEGSPAYAKWLKEQQSQPAAASRPQPAAQQARK